MRVARLILGVLPLVAASACALDEAVLLSPRQLAAYDIADVAYVGAYGVVVEIAGEPFPTEDKLVRQVVNDVIARDHFGQAFPVYSERPVGFRSPYRVVVAFDPLPAPGRASLCQSVPGSRAAGERLRVSAAFCAGEVLLSSVAGSAAGVAGPADVRFRQLLSQISTELFPPYDERGANSDEFLP